MKAWVEHYSRLLNVEFEWPCDQLPEVSPIAGPPPPVTLDSIRNALKRMKCCKAAGPSGITCEMLRAAGEEGMILLTPFSYSVSFKKNTWLQISHCILPL